MEGPLSAPPLSDPEPRPGGLSGRAKALIIVGALLCAAVFFGALLGAVLSSGDGAQIETSESAEKTSESAEMTSESVERDAGAGGGDETTSTGPGITEADQERCDPDVVGEEDGPIVAVYEVNAAMLGSLCFGNANGATVEAWGRLAAIAPDGFLDPVASLSGFDFDGEPDIIGFAIQLDGGGDQFAVAVEVDEAASDPEELQLTMVHELAHVFTQASDQFEFDAGEADCDGFYTYYGCFLEDSYINQWVRNFWSAEAIASLPEDGSTDEDGGDERCLVNPAFPGAYAASHPEEDFAESFAAYVFNVDLPDGVDPRLEFFTRYPELVAFRTNAEGLGLSDLPNNYDECG